MKKILLSLLCAAFAVSAFVSCSEDEDKEKGYNPGTIPPQPEVILPVSVGDDSFVGNVWNNVDGDHVQKWSFANGKLTVSHTYASYPECNYSEIFGYSWDADQKLLYLKPLQLGGYNLGVVKTPAEAWKDWCSYLYDNYEDEFYDFLQNLSEVDFELQKKKCIYDFQLKTYLYSIDGNSLKFEQIFSEDSFLFDNFYYTHINYEKVHNESTLLRLYTTWGEDRFLIRHSNFSNGEFNGNLYYYDSFYSVDSSLIGTIKGTYRLSNDRKNMIVRITEIPESISGKFSVNYDYVLKPYRPLPELLKVTE